MIQRVVFLIFLNLVSTVIYGQFIVAGDTASSNIYYKNIKDTIVPYAANSTSAVGVDIDGAEGNDISFQLIGYFYSNVVEVIKKAVVIDNIEFAVGSNNYWADTIAVGSVVNASMNWKKPSSGALLHYTHWFFGSLDNQSGEFVKANNYLAVRKIYPTDTIYGWFLLDMTSANAIKIKSFAFEKKCNTVPVTITSSNSVICVSGSATLTANGITSFIWSTGAITPSIVVTPTSTIAYSVQGTAYNGCNISSTITQSVVSANTPFPIVSSHSTLCSGESATLTVGSANSYTWSTGEQTPSIVITPAITETYSLAATINGCTVSSVFTQSVSACIGIKEYEMDKIKLYPNPVKEVLFLEAGLAYQSMDIEVLNCMGQSIIKGVHSNMIDVRELPPGLYFLKLKNYNQNSMIGKFVKE